MPLLCALALLAAASAPARATGAAPEAEDRARNAAARLDRALTALGGTGRLSSAASLTWETEGSLYWLNQGPTPAEPMRFRLHQRQHSDFEAGLTYVAFGFSGPESSFRRSAVLRHGDRSEDLLETLALSPAAVVRQLAARPADLRLFPRGDGGAVVVGPLMGRLVELDLGRDGLPRTLSYVFEDDLLGDATRRFDYLDYRRQDGWTLPRRVRQRDGGRLVRDTAVAAFAVEGTRPEWTEGLEARPAHAPGSPARFSAERIAAGLYHLKQHGGSDYHGLAVELADGWMVLETPLAIGDGTALRETLSALSPKPIVYAAATHHHDDHAAGMAALRSDAVTVLASPGNVAYFETMMAAPRGLSPPAAEPRVVALAPGQRIGPVRFLTIDASPHAGEMLLFHFPEQRILFHSDLGRFNDDGSVEPARPQTCALWSAIEENGLAVETIYSGHGRPGTLDDLRRSIALRGAPCP